MPGIAPRFMAWDRRMSGVAGPFSASGEASNGEPVQIELLINGEWVDITAYVMVRDNSGNVAVSRGRRDEGSTTEQSTCRMTLNNRDGRFSPRNPTGAYYGLIGRNQPVRVSVPNGIGGKSYRFQGEISIWPQSWDTTGTDVWTEVEGSGLLRRLSQGPPPAHSVLYEALTGPFFSTLLAYWPMEDPSGSLTMSTPLVTGSPMTYTSSPTLATYDDFPSSDPVPSLAGTSFTGGVQRYSVTAMTGYQARFLLSVPSTGFTDGDYVFRVEVDIIAAGAFLLQYFDIHYRAFDDNFSPGKLAVDARDVDQAFLGSTGTITMDVRGRQLLVSLEVEVSTVTLRVLDINSGETDSVSIGISPVTLTRVFSMTLAPTTLESSAGVTGGFAGHLFLQNGITAITDLGRALQPNGEAAGRRIERMCAENGIAFESQGDLDDSVTLGNQSRLSPLDLMQEAELADLGMLYESMPMLGIGYRTRVALLNQDAQLTLSYTGFNLSDIPTPVEDDRYIQNQVTVTADGISQKYEATTGTLSTSPPPAGVGIYGTDISLNLENSSAALDQAAWRVHLGTVDEPRYPQISVNLNHSSFTTNPTLKQAVLGLKQGDRILIQNLPSWLPPGDIDQIILGFDETITHFEHHVTFICAPASPYTVGVLDSDAARIDTDGSELLTAVSSSATALVVVPSTTHLTLWTKDTADMPFDVRLGGEVVRVTAVTDWLSDTFTRTESNGWGTSDTGSTWTTGGGVASDYAVSGTIGTATLSTVDASRRTSTTAVDPDFDVYCDISTSDLATGDSLYGAVTARMQDSGNMYLVRVAFTTANAIVIDLNRIVADVQTVLASYTLPDTHVAGQFARIRFQGIGSSLKAKAWMATAAIEPPEWHATATDTSISSAHSFGTRSIRVTGNTNAASVAIQYDNYRVVNPQTFTVTRGINGVTKSHSAGTDIRLATPAVISL